MKEATSHDSRKRNSEDAGLGTEGEDALGDMATSPVKPTVPIQEGSKEKLDAQKKLELDGVQMENKTSEQVPPPPPKYVSPREQKRSRKENKGKHIEDDRAGSLEVCPHAQ